MGYLQYHISWCRISSFESSALFGLVMSPVCHRIYHAPRASDWKDDHPKSRHGLSNADIGDFVGRCEGRYEGGQKMAKIKGLKVIFNPIDLVCCMYFWT